MGGGDESSTPGTSNGPKKLAGIQVSSSAYGQVIPLIYGTCRVPATLIWTSDFTSVPITEAVAGGGGKGGGGGGGGTIVVGFNYYSSVILSLADGSLPDGSIGRIWRDTTVGNASDAGFGFSYNYGGITSNPWLPNHLYTAGDVVTNGATTYVYQCITTGTSAASGGPTTTGASITDGTAKWKFNSATEYPLAHPDKALAYYGTVIAYNSYTDLGESGTLKNLNFEVKGLCADHLDTASGWPGYDCLPSAIIKDLFTDPYHGAGWDDMLEDTTTSLRWTVTELDGISAVPTQETAYDTFCLANGYWLSYALTSKTALSNVVDEILDATNSTCLWGVGHDGKFKLKLLPLGDIDILQRDNIGDYIPNKDAFYSLNYDDYLGAVDENNQATGSDPLTITLNSNQDIKNSIPVEFSDRALEYATNLVEFPEPRDAAQNGIKKDSSKALSCITNKQHALGIASVLSQRNVYIRTEFTASLPYRYSLLEPGDLVKLSDPTLGLVEETVKIKSINYPGDESLSSGMEVTFVEWPYGVAGATLFEVQTSEGQPSPLQSNANPGNAFYPVIAPLSLLATVEQKEFVIATTGLSADFGGADVWVSTDNTKYAYLGSINGPCTYGDVYSSQAFTPQDWWSDPSTAWASGDQSAQNARAAHFPSPSNTPWTLDTTNKMIIQCASPLQTLDDCTSSDCINLHHPLAIVMGNPKHLTLDGYAPSTRLSCQEILKYENVDLIDTGAYTPTITHVEAGPVDGTVAITLAIQDSPSTLDTMYDIICTGAVLNGQINNMGPCVDVTLSIDPLTLPDTNLYSWSLGHNAKGFPVDYNFVGSSTGSTVVIHGLIATSEDIAYTTTSVTCKIQVLDADGVTYNTRYISHDVNVAPWWDLTAEEILGAVEIPNTAPAYVRLSSTPTLLWDYKWSLSPELSFHYDTIPGYGYNITSYDGRHYCTIIAPRQGQGTDTEYNYVVGQVTCLMTLNTSGTVTNPRKTVIDVQCDYANDGYALKRNSTIPQTAPKNSSCRGNVYEISKLYRTAYGTKQAPDGVSLQWVLLDGNPLICKLPYTGASDIYFKFLAWNQYHGGKQALDSVEPWVIPTKSIEIFKLTGSAPHVNIGDEVYPAVATFNATTSQITSISQPILAGTNKTLLYNQETHHDGSAISKVSANVALTTSNFDVCWRYPVNPTPDYFTLYLVGHSTSAGKSIETILAVRQTANGRIRQMSISQDSAGVGAGKFTSFSAWVVPVYLTVPTPILYETADDIQLPPWVNYNSQPRAYTTVNSPTMVNMVDSLDAEVTTYATITSQGTITRSVTYSGFGSDLVPYTGTLTVTVDSQTEAHSYAGAQGYWHDVPNKPEKGGGNRCCVLPGTMITMADSSDRAVESVRVGDEVYSYDEGCDEYNIGMVTEIETPIRDGYYEVTLENLTVLRITNDHAIRTTSGWKAISPNKVTSVPCTPLSVGHAVVLVNGDYSVITNIRGIPGETQVYDLKNITLFHNYFADGVLVHNNNCSDSSSGTSGGGSVGGDNGSHDTNANDRGDGYGD